MLVSVALSLLCGESLSLSESVRGIVRGPWSDDAHAMIMWWVRIPELLAALIAGATLALAGAAMQSLMRNDLADPYLMGVASGGGVGAALALSLGLINLLGLWILPMMSFGGALLASVWIELYARRLDARNGSLGSTQQVILAGVALSLCLSSLLTLILALSEERLGGVWRWLIGHIHGLSWVDLGLMSFGACIGGGTLLRLQRALSLMQAGEEVAWTLGVPTRRVRSLTLLATSCSVGAVVAYCGAIGFVGLLVPHAIRPRISGESHHLFGLSALYGAGVLCLCAWIAKMAPVPLPVGVITGVLGGGMFLYTQYRISAPYHEQ